MKKFGFALIILFFTALLIPWKGIPTFKRVREEFHSSQGTQIYLDRNGKEFHRENRTQRDRRQNWITLDSIPEHFKQTLLLIEDKRYDKHRGVDFKAFVSAIDQWRKTGRLRGASTISMQLASLLQYEGRSVSKNAFEKAQQIIRALWIESFWSKSEILEAYINLVTYRGDLVGIDAAAQGLFQKFPHGLSADESLILASLLSSPNTSAERIAAKTCLFAAKAHCETLKDLCRKHLSNRARLPPSPTLAPHFARLIQSHSSRVPTTLDSHLQQASVEAIQSHLLSLRKQNVKDAAVIVANHQTGEILAYVGSSGNLSSAPEVDGVKALRQAGSTLKPLLYAKALDENLMTGNTLLDDSPYQVQTSSGLYSPENYDRTFKGILPARTALASSLNIPAVRVIDLLGVQKFYRTLIALGFTLRKEDTYGHSLSLGAADVSLKQLAEAYGTLARGGTKISFQITPQDKVVSQSIFSPSTTRTIGEILSSKDERALSFGLDNPLSTPYFTAVKTGTSKDMRDNWCLGYDETYVVGVWVGNFDGSPMWDVSGISGAAPIWRTLFDTLHPDGYERQTVKALRPEPLLTRIENKRETIVYPIDGTLIAFDPDIPAENQAIVFEHTGSQSVLWTLDGRILKSDTVRLEEIEKGAHQLTLLSTDREILDQVSFEIRGKTAHVAAKNE
ncbi:MAG: penicillin-binding protein 1C [Proteobacteria bacterium]|nr:MAG: penicillin-binding protein 1C [Pseudomonadota bacterium]